MKRPRDEGSRLRLIRNPITQFLVIGLVTVAAIIIGVNYLAGDAATDEALAEATKVNDILAHQFIEARIPPAFEPGSTGGADQLDRRLRRLQRVEGLDQAIIRDSDGTVLYANGGGASLLNTTLPLDTGERKVLARGGSGSRTVVRRDESGVASEDARLELSTRIITPNGVPLLFTGYYSLDQVEERQGEIFTSFRWIVVAPLLLLIVIATAILTALTRQVRRGAAERERLLQTAMDASDAERRRIARDLHDGVVQDLAGTAFSLSAVARTPELPSEGRETLDKAGRSLRGSLKSLRSLLAEIHPPDLRADGLAAALGDLIAPAGTVGMQASVSVEGAETASDDQAALVWRVAQEAVRNAIRHSHASTLAVTVRGDQERLTLEVVDDGIGFDPKVTAPDSFGLRGLRSLVADHGGVLEVRSAPGEGTTVRMEVEAQ